MYIINLIPLHVFCLLLMGRYEHKLYVSYTTFYCIGQLMAMNIPFVGFQPIKTSEHMASAGVFALLQVWSGFNGPKPVRYRTVMKYSGLCIFGLHSNKIGRKRFQESVLYFGDNSCWWRFRRSRRTDHVGRCRTMVRTFLLSVGYRTVHLIWLRNQPIA